MLGLISIATRQLFFLPFFFYIILESILQDWLAILRVPCFRLLTSDLIKDDNKIVELLR